MQKEKLAMPVPEFCQSASISVRHFYALCARGEGPTVTRIGRRNLITPENGRDWLKRHEVPPAA